MQSISFFCPNNNHMADIIPKQLAKTVAVHCHNSAEEFYEMLDTSPSDVLVADTQMQYQGAALDLVAYIKDLQLPTRSLLLTSEESNFDVITCLRSGADDCVITPCDYEEVAVRLQRLLLIQHQYLEETFEFGSTKYQPENSLLVAEDGFNYHLRPRVNQVLEVLCRHRGSIVTRELLREKVWQGETCKRNTIDTYIRDVRKVLGDDSYITTMYGCGYRLRNEDEMSHTSKQGAS